MANVILSKIFETIISVTCWKRDPFPIFYEVVAVVEEVLILKVLTLKEFSRQVSDSASVHYNFSFFPDELRNFRDILVTQLNISIFLAPNRSFSNFITLFIYRCNISKCQMQWMWAASKYDFCVKNGLILPTGQWYAPSAVIKHPRYYMVLPGIAWYCMVLHNTSWYCMLMHGIAWYCMILHGFVSYCIVSYDIAWCCMV